MVTTTLKYSEKPIRQASRRCWWRRVGFSFLITLALLTGFLAYQLTTGGETWLISALSAAALFNFFLMAASYILNFRQALYLLRAMTVPEAVLTLEDKTFTVVSDAGESVTQWASVESVWCFDEVWFFILSKGAHITLPVTELTPESKAFITSKVDAKNVHEHFRGGQGSIDKPTWIRAGFTINTVTLATVWLYFDPPLSFWLVIYYTLSGVLFLYSFFRTIQEARKARPHAKDQQV